MAGLRPGQQGPPETDAHGNPKYYNLEPGLLSLHTAFTLELLRLYPKLYRNGNLSDDFWPGFPMTYSSFQGNLTGWFLLGAENVQVPDTNPPEYIKMPVFGQLVRRIEPTNICANRGSGGHAEFDFMVTEDFGLTSKKIFTFVEGTHFPCSKYNPTGEASTLYRAFDGERVWPQLYPFSFATRHTVGPKIPGVLYGPRPIQQPSETIPLGYGKHLFILNLSGATSVIGGTFTSVPSYYGQLITSNYLLEQTNTTLALGYSQPCADMSVPNLDYFSNANLIWPDTPGTRIPTTTPFYKLNTNQPYPWGPSVTHPSFRTDSGISHEDLWHIIHVSMNYTAYFDDGADLVSKMDELVKKTTIDHIKQPGGDYPVNDTGGQLIAMGGNGKSVTVQLLVEGLENGSGLIVPTRIVKYLGWKLTYCYAYWGDSQRSGFRGIKAEVDKPYVYYYVYSNDGDHIGPSYSLLGTLGSGVILANYSYYTGNMDRAVTLLPKTSIYEFTDENAPWGEGILKNSDTEAQGVVHHNVTAYSLDNGTTWNVLKAGGVDTQIFDYCSLGEGRMVFWVSDTKKLYLFDKGATSELSFDGPFMNIPEAKRSFKQMISGMALNQYAMAINVTRDEEQKTVYLTPDAENQYIVLTNRSNLTIKNEGQIRSVDSVNVYYQEPNAPAYTFQSGRVYGKNNNQVEITPGIAQGWNVSFMAVTYTREKEVEYTIAANLNTYPQMHTAGINAKSETSISATTFEGGTVDPVHDLEYPFMDSTAGPLHLLGGALLPASLQAPDNYSATITYTGGTPPVTFEFVSGELPPNLTFSAYGVISGTLNEAAILADMNGNSEYTYSFTIRAMDYSGSSVAAVYSITVTT